MKASISIVARIGAALVVFLGAAAAGQPKVMTTPPSLAPPPPAPGGSPPPDLCGPAPQDRLEPDFCRARPFQSGDDFKASTRFKVRTQLDDRAATGFGEGAPCADGGQCDGEFVGSPDQPRGGS